MSQKQVRPARKSEEPVEPQKQKKKPAETSPKGENATTITVYLKEQKPKQRWISFLTTLTAF